MLDDNVYIGPALTAWAFCHRFRDLAEDVNLRLAPFSHNKAFEPRQKGEILSLTYDMESWTVSLCDQKLAILLRLLYSVADSDMVDNEDLEVINGKITHYHILTGKLNTLTDTNLNNCLSRSLR